MSKPIYDESTIKSLDWKEHIRTRPGMYIGKLGDGSSNDDGIYILLKEVIDNCIDEYVMGYGKTIEVKVSDKKVIIRDYGRGIPLGKLIDCVSKINTGGKYDTDAFKKSVGLNGVGTKAVNALSEVFIIQSIRDGESKIVDYSEGNILKDNKIEKTTLRNGTRVVFKPDHKIFKNFHFLPEYVEDQIWNYVYLNSGLTINYNNEKFYSLNGLNFKIYPGELIGIVGPVGCGKTTLAKSLGRTIEIPDGQLFIDNIDIKDIKLDDLRKNVSIVPQEAFLFTSTISENIRFGKPRASKDLVKKSASKACLIDDINNFPNGFKTIVGERGITLSGGQRQRTALGRALLLDSSVIILDDALASVDNKTAAKIIDEMSDRSNKTIIMISHQLSVAATCDRVLVMDKGEIVQEGVHVDLVKENGLYKQLWEREIATNIVKS